jgi:uncharacterized protein YhaN
MSEERFGRVEERLAQIEARVQGMDDEFSRRTNILLDEILVLTQDLDRLTQRVDCLTERVDRLVENQQNTQATVAQLATLMVQLARDAEADRATIRDNQVEIRRIWEYLLGQSGNGRRGASN